MTRFCEQCGTPLEPNENFCSSCGAKVIRDEPPQPTYTPPPKSTPQPTYTPPKSTHVESTSQPAAENNMGKFLALIGIVLVLFGGIYLAHDRNVSEETSLGEFYLGMSKDEADRKFGAGVTNDRGYNYANGYFWLEFNEYNKAVMIICYDETVNTKKGIHVGSMLIEVKHVYGTDYEFNDTDFPDTPAYIYRFGNQIGGNSRLFFFIDKETNRVRAIRLDKY